MDVLFQYAKHITLSHLNEK